MLSIIHSNNLNISDYVSLHVNLSVAFDFLAQCLSLSIISMVNPQLFFCRSICHILIILISKKSYLTRTSPGLLGSRLKWQMVYSVSALMAYTNKACTSLSDSKYQIYPLINQSIVKHKSLYDAIFNTVCFLKIQILLK